VTIFLTTHRLDEAERVCDRVAILNKTLRMIGRPAELREHLFATTLAVRTLVPLADPDRVFGGIATVDRWHDDRGTPIILSTRIALECSATPAPISLSSGAARRPTRPSPPAPTHIRPSRRRFRRR
jgi:ABC-2 type transport system ATP-binding protein